KALDSAIDTLARRLGQLPPDKADALLPRDAWALARMFPVLRRVEAFARAPVREAKEAHELRRRATTALRELFGRMADRAPLVLFIDDLQWSDDDSTELLEELLTPPDAPAVLLVVTSRDAQLPAPGKSRQALELPLQGLSAEEALQLARQVLPDAPPSRPDRVSRESGGNPFLLQQLAAFGAESNLDEVVMARAAQLEDHPRRLLEAICLSGRPLDARVAAAAVGLPEDDGPVRLLKGARLVRATPSGDRERLEAWHDRIRETVVASLSPDAQQRLHLGLADALAAHAPTELDALAVHLLEAGQTARAADATARAAKLAEGQLAFDRAAVLYRQALELLPPQAPLRYPLTVSLGDCLADAGRGPGAAAAYALAVEQGGCTEGEALELKRRGAEQLLRSGHVDRGLAALREVVAGVGMTLAPVPWRAAVALLYRRAHLLLRGLEFNERPESAIDPAILRRIDVCWSVSVGLAMIDTIRGASFQTRQLLLALDAGEPYRVARALAAEASFVATIGNRGEALAARLIKESQALATRAGDPLLQGLIEFCTGLTQFLLGRWQQAQAHQVEAERLFREAGSAVTWEVATARLIGFWSLFYLGDLDQLSRRLPALLDEARRRGDRYTITSLQSGLASVALLAADQPDRARASVREVLGGWSTESFLFQHYWSLLSEGMIDLYQGDGESCWQRLRRDWPSLQNSMFLRVQNVRVEARFLRARSCLATGRLGLALADAERMEGEGVEWARAFSLLIRSAVAAGRQMPERALSLLTRAIALLEAGHMALFAAAARARLGELEGGELGAARIKAGHAWMLAQGVKDPEAMTRMLVPRAQVGVTAAKP
ncbi:MAG: pknB 32, partial [Myxococcaceae bacterium]|nr:pknB 32 [Myxococcaceae bacterium]